MHERGEGPADWEAAAVFGRNEQEDKQSKTISDDKIIEVCAGCGRACCWYGEFMCADARYCTTKTVSVGVLRSSPSLENESYWSDEKMIQVFGEPNPFGSVQSKEG